MSAQIVRKSLIGFAAAVAILAGGVWTGRLAAGPLGHGRHFRRNASSNGSRTGSIFPTPSANRSGTS